ARVSSIDSVSGRTREGICSHTGRTSRGKNAPEIYIVEKNSAITKLNASMSCTWAVIPSDRPAMKVAPTISGTGASTAQGEVAAPKITNTVMMMTVSNTACVNAQSISPKACDSTSTGVARIASYVD